MQYASTLPQGIAQCLGEADVQTCLQWAQAYTRNRFRCEPAGTRAAIRGYRGSIRCECVRIDGRVRVGGASAPSSLLIGFSV